MRSIPQGPRRINSKSSGLRGASSLQDTKRQGAGDSPRDWDSNSFLAKLPVNFYTFQKEFVLASSNLFHSELKNAKV